MAHSTDTQDYYCTNCGTTGNEEGECCGSLMLNKADAEGFGLSDFEPEGTNSLDLIDDWN